MIQIHLPSFQPPYIPPLLFRIGLFIALVIVTYDRPIYIYVCVYNVF